MHDAYLWVSFLHHIASVAWLGWMAIAPMLLSPAFDGAARTWLRRRVTWLAVVCIGGGGVLAWGSGWLMAKVLSPDAFSLYWLNTGVAVFVAASAVWLAALLPWYRKLSRQDAPARGQVRAWKAVATGTAALGAWVMWLMTVRPV